MELTKLNERALNSKRHMLNIYMLFTRWEVRIGKNCARGLEYDPRPQAEGRTRDRGHSFFPIRTDQGR